MLSEARLVTPEGKIVRLSVAEYQKVSQSLPGRIPSSERPDRTEIMDLDHELQGKYSKGKSPTKALLEERRHEREREAGLRE
jgi:hypothetical protein